MSDHTINAIYDYFYLARQPIFDNADQIWGYELLFRSGSDKVVADITNQDMATLCVATCGFIKSQEFVDQTKKICINFTEKLILEGAPRGLPPSVTVIEVLEDIQPSDRLMEVLIELKQEGYCIAIDDYEGSDNQKALLDLADIIKVDILNKSREEIEALFTGIETKRALKIAEKVDDREIIPHLKEWGCNLYQGYFFAKPENLSGRKLKSTAMSKLRILQILEEPALNTQKLEEVIAADPSLTYRLLRFLNSAAFGFSMTIDSVRHAILLLGLKRLKYWLRMVVLSDLVGSQKTPELYIMALNRGRLLEELAHEGHIADSNPETMFMFGLLSLIETMLDIPIDRVMQELPLSDGIKAGYLDTTSIYSKYLQLAVSLEHADASETNNLCAVTGLRGEDVAAASVRSMAWTDTIYQHMH